MANMVYANPFGSYVEGQQAGTRNAIDIGNAARNFRDSDLKYDFMKWYMPNVQQNQALAELSQQQNAAYYLALQNAGRTSGITGNYAPVNNAINQMYGINANLGSNPHTQWDIDTRTDALGKEGAAFNYPGFYAGGGVRGVLPAGNQPMSELDKIRYNNELLLEKQRQQQLQNPQSQNLGDLSSHFNFYNPQGPQPGSIGANIGQTAQSTGGNNTPGGIGGVSSENSTSSVPSIFVPTDNQTHNSSNSLTNYGDGQYRPDMGLYNFTQNYPGN